MKALGINSLKTVIFLVGAVLNALSTQAPKNYSASLRSEGMLDVINISERSLFFKSSNKVISFFLIVIESCFTHTKKIKCSNISVIIHYMARNKRKGFEGYPKASVLRDTGSEQMVLRECKDYFPFRNS